MGPIQKPFKSSTNKGITLDVTRKFISITLKSNKYVESVLITVCIRMVGVITNDEK